MALPTISLSSSSLASEVLRISSLPAASSTSSSGSTTEGAGFFSLVDHGIPSELIKRTFAASADYFERETWDNKKATIDPKGHTGWTQVGAEHLDPTKTTKGDVKESFYLSLAVLSDPPSKNCSPQTLPPTLAEDDNQAALLDLLSHCRRVCASLLQAFEQALELKAGKFNGHHQGGEDDRLRLIRYPSQHPSTSSAATQHNEAGDSKGIRAGAHTDYGSLTLLFQSEIGGLQVHNFNASSEGEAWLDVPPQPDAIIVNAGDALEFWSAGLFPSTLHRVVEPRTDEERGDRYSMAYFHHPSSGSVLKPLREELPSQLKERLPKEEEWKKTCRKKGIPLPEDHGGEYLTAGQHLKIRLGLSYKDEDRG